MVILGQHLIKYYLTNLGYCDVFVELFVIKVLFILFALNYEFDIIHLFFVPLLQLATLLLILKSLNQNYHQLIPCRRSDWKKIRISFFESNQPLFSVFYVKTMPLVFVQGKHQLIEIFSLSILSD